MNNIQNTSRMQNGEYQLNGSDLEISTDLRVKNYTGTGTRNPTNGPGGSLRIIIGK